MERDIKFFDCSSMLGSSNADTVSGFDTVDRLAEYMGYCGIQRVLVYNAVSLYGNPQEGNRILIRELHNSEFIFPCAVAIPHHTGEFPDPAEFCRFLQYNNIRAVRIFPSLYGLSMDIWLWEDLFRELEKCRVPVFVDFSIKHWSEGIDWNGVSGICTAFPELPVILLRMGPRTDRFIYPLFVKHRNLMMDTSYYIIHRGIENTTRLFGAERLLFGSGMPVYNPFQPMTVVALSGLDDNTVDKIAGDNLTALMEAVRLDVF